ncbi:NUDIX domain-containing protein [Actinokineospora auranticolor]|uniref:ADP-ribose pyrophosphatase YjhB (NUDIX family) n=1 Tax=Actinokineospora auranticolor TaxID=155976 RepID=A0A2S6GUW1_9PSEU|nr:NUDIX domain-containing protein [Actinokineospora auranticolor]PPK69028.1 ADP-ribose pyrophosphatase YjhB (NUDIX family) [Actinokineospora auranticolor]
MSQSSHLDLDTRPLSPLDPPGPGGVRRTAVGAGILVLDDAGLLLMLRSRDGHRLPGGPQPARETLPNAAVRAVEERTGVLTRITGLVGVYSDASEPWSAELAVCFRGRPVEGRLRVGTAVWVEPERLADLGVPEATRLVVEHGLDDHPDAYFI